MKKNPMVLMFIPIVLLVFVIIFLTLIYHFHISNTFSHGSRLTNKISLTFDDGPAQETLDIIKVLRENNVSATFFVVGERVEANPEIFKELVKSGNEIAGHTYSHPHLSFKSLFSIRKEIEKTDEILAKYNISTYLFRTPEGHVSILTWWEATRLGKKIILFDTISHDYSNPGKDVIINNVLSKVKSGSIIDFHDYAYWRGETTQTADALKILIPELKKKYEIVPISELINPKKSLVFNFNFQ
jgi:peptidoglycan/xylan/chitin deacetylase (PgdA/CDA1 family)